MAARLGLNGELLTTVVAGIYAIVFITALIRTPRVNTDTLDGDLLEDEEEGLLASTGRRFNATWQDITGRARKNNPGTGGAYGATH